MPSPETHFLVAVRDPAEGRVIRAALEELGFLNLVVVDDGRDALKAYWARPTYFFIAAWELPNLGGLRLVKEIRKSEASSRQPCVLILPRANESEMNLLEGTKVTGFLIRPVTIEGVKAKIGELVKKQEEYRWPNALDDRVQHLLDYGRTAEALVELERVRDTGRRRLAGIHTEMGLALEMLDKPQQAVEHLEKAVAADSGASRAQAGLGRSYLALGRFDDATQALERAVFLDPQNDEIKKDLADSLQRADRDEEAERHLSDLLKKRPRDLDLLNRLGISLRKQSKFEKAVAVYKRAIGLSDQDGNLFFNLGRSYFEGGRFKEAEAALQKAVFLDSNHDEARQLLERAQRRQEKTS